MRYLHRSIPSLQKASLLKRIITERQGRWLLPPDKISVLQKQLHSPTIISYNHLIPVSGADGITNI
jgi:hypothetical protein